jgi:hypothetical protein
LLLCFCLCLCVTAAKAQYRIDQWTADDGLPQNSVYGIVQTKDGYLWLATLDGLARFDGVRFTIFNKSNSPGIVNNRFVSLFEAANGDLWAGTEESGVARFRGGRFEHFGAEEGAPRRVNIIEAAGNGVVIFDVTEAFHFSDGRFSPFNEQSNLSPSARASLSPNKVIRCYTDPEVEFSKCLIDGRWQSFSLSDDFSKEKFVSAAKEENSLTVRYASAAQEANGNVWLITADGKLARAENGRVTGIYDERDGLPKFPLFFMTGSRLGLIAKDADGSLWLVDLPSMQKELLLKKAAVPPPLERGRFHHLHGRRRQSLVRHGRDGLFRARKQIITAYSEADGIADKNVYPIYQTAPERFGSERRRTFQTRKRNFYLVNPPKIFRSTPSAKTLPGAF